MNVRLGVFALLLAAFSTANAEVTVKDGAYHNLVVSFSPNVDAEKGLMLVESLEQLLTETSTVLQKAIGLRIGGVTLQLPSTWDTSSWEGKTLEHVAVLPDDQRDFVVDDTVDSAFGKLPFALQFGGCGVPGRRLTVPVEFLNATEEYPRGKLLAREWLKFRYGVFDENGFDGDDMYPTYYQIPGTTEAKITECTHPEVEYYFKDADGNNCSLEIPFASSADCVIHPKEESLNTTSSLMYYHKELYNMDSVCGDENHTHNDFTPSKQNILCDGKSIWDILKKSGDFNTTTIEEHAPENEGIKFSYHQERKPRVVLAFEYSENLNDQREMVLFALRRFIHSLPDGSELGVYSFNEQPTEIRKLSELGTERDVVIPQDFDSNRPICSTCVLEKVIEVLSDKPEAQSSVILITGSDTSAVDRGLVEKFKALNICLKIIAIISEEDKLVEGYKELLSYSNCGSIEYIKKDTSNTFFDLLHQSLKVPVLQSPTDTKIYTITSVTMSPTNSLDIDMDSNAAKYTLWTARLVQGINCSTADASIELTPSIQFNNVASYTFDPVDQTVTCQLGFPKTLDVLTLVEKTSKPGKYFDGAVWVHDPSQPEGEQMPVILYAEIKHGRYPVRGAKVTATVISEDGKKEAFELFDNGRGNPDVTYGDGVYSRSFVDFTNEGNYIVIVIASDDAGNSQIGTKGQEYCCGSKVASTSEQAPFFSMSFRTSFRAKQKSKGGYKPSKIFDLRVAKFDPMNYIVLNWTAPGGEADQGNVSSYILKHFISREDAQKDFNKGKFLTTEINPQPYGGEESWELKLDNFERNSVYYVAMRSSNEHGHESETSNILEFFVPEDTDATKIDEGTTADPSLDDKQSGVDKKTIGIVIGVLVLVIVLVVAVYLFVYFFVRKPRRKEAAANKSNGGGNRNASNPPISLNSIPADVILKHHNEVVNAKSQHKDPPIFKEENLESIDLSSDSEDVNASNQRNNVEYSTVQKRQPEPTNHRQLERETTHQMPPKSPKRMTNV